MTSGLPPHSLNRMHRRSRRTRGSREYVRESRGMQPRGGLYWWGAHLALGVKARVAGGGR